MRQSIFSRASVKVRPVRVSPRPACFGAGLLAAAPAPAVAGPADASEAVRAFEAQRARETGAPWEGFPEPKTEAQARRDAVEAREDGRHRPRGVGHSWQDELWWAEQTRAGRRDDGPTDADFDRMAADREWADHFDGGSATNPGPGGVCGGCRRTVDFLEPSGLCLPCDLSFSDTCTQGNRGF